jgi:hypothetical protein
MLGPPLSLKLSVMCNQVGDLEFHFRELDVLAREGILIECFAHSHNPPQTSP